MSKKISEKIDNKIGMNTVWRVITVLLIAVLATVIVAIISKLSNTSNRAYIPSSSSTTTDWNAYCRDLYPDSPSARQSCVNGAKTSEKLMNGEYNK